MAKLKDFLNEQAKRIGLDKNPDFMLMLSASALNEVEIPDPIASKFDSELFTIDSAKGNFDIKNHFIENYMKGYDQMVIENAKEAGLSLESLEEIKAIKQSGERVKRVIKELKALEEKAKKESGKGNSEEFVKKLSEAEERVKKIEAEKQQEIENTKAGFISKLERLWEKTQIAGIQWSDAIPEAARLPTLNTLIESELAENGGLAIFDPEKNEKRLVNAKDQSLPFQIGGKVISHDELKSLILQKHKLIKEAGSGGNDPGTFGNNNWNPTNNGGDPGNKAAPLPKRAQGALGSISELAGGLVKLE